MAKKKAPSFDECRAEYATLWSDCEIRPERQKTVEVTARRIIANRPRYERVSQRTGVPWFMIGIIHQMECNLGFHKHLHNGNPMYDKNGRPIRTTDESANRPAVWPAPKGEDPWEWSAIDALTMPGKQFDRIKDWSIERICYCLELYNGFGYRLYRGIHSPYLWSFTRHYVSGKYVSDKVWSKTAVSGQSGAIAILKAMAEIDPLSVDLTKPEVRSWPAAPGPERGTGPAATTPAAEAAKSKSVWSLIVAFLLSVVQWFTHWMQGTVDWLASWFQAMPGIASYVTDGLAPLGTLATALKIDITSASVTAAGALIIIAIVRHSRDKAELANHRAANQGEVEE